MTPCFSEGREDAEDVEILGRPITIETEENVEISYSCENRFSFGRSK
jgi:hypothetical protein